MSTVLRMSRWFEGCGLVHASQRTAQLVDWASQLPSTSPLSQSESLRLACSRSYIIVCVCVCVCVCVRVCVWSVFTFTGATLCFQLQGNPEFAAGEPSTGDVISHLSEYIFF